ncbi:MAG TPA: hypothetical protein VHC97_28370 [Thermoanaerobaculia bacterium]|nr:hypothetical protein [Thermoanaerobaculia bacterium]
MRKAPPWLLLIAGLMVGYPAARIAVPDKAPTTASQSKPSPRTEASSPCPGPRCEILRVLGEFFGLPPGTAEPAGVGEAAARAGYEMRFLMALVPVPPDPRLDQALDALQRGFAQSGWLVDRVWLPWTGEGAKREAAAQGSPGLLLFRKQWADGTRTLALVFLVGETPKAGLQKDAFREALDLIADLQPLPESTEGNEDAAEPEGAQVSILGPSFSGSVESLRVAMGGWKTWEQEHRGVPPRPLLHFRAASGSATAQALEPVFEEMGVEFCRTVVPDGVLQELALPFLRDEMGWDLSRVALLTESDTAYGSSVLKAETSGDEEEHKHPRLIMVPFPSHISELRNAAQAEKGKEEKNAASAPLPAGRRLLDIDLTDPDRPPDLVPTFNELTLRSNELMLQNLLETLAREGVQAVGIVATDPKDKLFLAEKVREAAPDTVLFTFDNDLLFAHPQYAETLDGMLVFTSAPLFTEGAPWLAGSLRSEGGRERRQSTSELQQGDYEAVRYLLGETNVSRPRAWITAVGNGSLWPVARLPVPGGHLAARLCGNPVDPDSRAEMEGNGFAGKDDLQMLLVALGLVALGYLLRRAALVTPVPGLPLDPTPGSRRLLVLGLILLALAAGMLLAVGSMPLWARYLSLGRLGVRWETAQILYLAGLAAVYALLVANTARSAHGRVTRVQGLAWALAGVAALVVLGAIVWGLCVPGRQVEFFHLRARAFSSGLSPLVSLAAVGGAVYAWILWELKRRRLIARQSTDCPVENLGDPAVAGVDPILKAVRALLIRTFPEDRRFWFLPAVAFLPPVFLLWATVLPVGEARGYGRLFILFVTLALSLGALSYFRFFLLWRWTSRLLRRLDNASAEVADAFKAIAKDLEWRPIQSFSWQLPPFKTPTVSVRRLKALAAAGKVAIPGGPEALDERLKEVFANERDDGSPQEIAARNHLEEIFRQACIDLRRHGGEPDVLQFFALRVSAWLRYVFAHMRCCLIGALICGLFALVGVTAYVFQPKQFVSLAVVLALAAAVGLTLLVFLQMDRNATLSRIGETTPGKVSFDRTFWTKIFTYVGIPALGLVATQFPEVGALLGRLANAVLRVTGGG